MGNIVIALKNGQQFFFITFLFFLLSQYRMFWPDFTLCLLVNDRITFKFSYLWLQLIGGRNGYDYKAVRRWTTQRKLGYGLLECDKVVVRVLNLHFVPSFMPCFGLLTWICQSWQIFVPIHKEVHWCLAVINVKDKSFQYLDSLGGRDLKVLKVLVCIAVSICCIQNC